MAFVRKRRGFRRRMRRRWEQDRIVLCDNRLPMEKTSPCCKQVFGTECPTNVDAIPLLTMTIPFSVAPERYPSTMATRKMIFGGMKFESHWWVNPQDWTGDGCPSFANFNFVVKIWEAIVILPLQQGSTFAPAYLPDLACAVDQASDLADRVLWKRVSMLPVWGFDIVQILPQLETSKRDQDGGQQLVKVRAAVDDRHGIFLVRQIVHDLVLTSAQDPCGLFDCSMPLHNEFWGSLFYRAA